MAARPASSSTLFMMVYRSGIMRVVSTPTTSKAYSMPAQARVINMLDLRKTREIKLVDGGVAGLFCIVPVSADGQHPGYLMRADTAANAQEWVTGLNKVRAIELEKSPVESEGRQPEETVCCCIRRRRPAEATRLVN